MDDNDFQSDLLHELINLMDNNDFEEITYKINKFDYDINYDQNKNSLINHACDEFNKEGIKLCIENKIDYDNLGYGGAILMDHYSNQPDETLTMIDNIINYIIENQGNIWQLYHRSLTWNHIEIHKHLLNKYRSLINFDWFEHALEMCGRFGLYDLIKNLFDIDEYKTLISLKMINKCLLEVITVDCTCDKDRYKLIKFLVKNKNASIDESYKNSTKLMERINIFLTTTTASYYNNYNTEFKYIYMPNIFKKDLY